MKIVKFVLIIMFLAVIGFVAYRALSKDEKTYETIFPEKRDISEVIFIPGNVFPAKEIEVKSQLSGILEEIFVKIGDSVGLGTSIASVRLVPNSADIERFENALNLTQLDYNAISVEYERAKRLYKTQSISAVEMNDAKRNYLQAKERLTSAKNQLDILQKGRVASKHISNIVTSSTSGTVIDMPLEVGASIIERNNFNPGTTIAVIAETDIFKFRTLVAEQYLKHIVLGDTVILTFNTYQDLSIKAVVTKISSKGNSENGIMKYMMDAEFAVTADMPVLRSGYSATAEITLNARKNALSLEEKHITYEKDSSCVFIFNGKDKIKKRVDLGISDGIYTEIVDGITLEDKIIKNNGQVN